MLYIFKRIVLLILISNCFNTGFAFNQNPYSNSHIPINQKVLFIGNSFTFYWNLPSQVEQMSIESGLNFDVNHISIPSAKLRDHWNNPNLKLLLKNETFDHIIIQEHSTYPLSNPDDTKVYFDLIRSLIPPKTQIHFFSTWMYPTIEKFNTMNLEYPIEESIKLIVSKTNTKIIPVGRAFKLFKARYPKFNLLMEDNKHPNPNGTYLASCVIYSHITGQSSLNLSKRYKGKDSKEVDIYYSIVEDEVLNYIQQISDEIIL
ncbi:MAG: Uncharacterised protein [Flavobacteriales bacterium]|nr:MAG: Uncharacterised protein [Flavobacteriales bacterium]